MSDAIKATPDRMAVLAQADHRYLAALTELLVRLPPLPEVWPPGAVQAALRAALDAADQADPSSTNPNPEQRTT